MVGFLREEAGAARRLKEYACSMNFSYLTLKKTPSASASSAPPSRGRRTDLILSTIDCYGFVVGSNSYSRLPCAKGAPDEGG